MTEASGSMPPNTTTASHTTRGAVRGRSFGWGPIVRLPAIPLYVDVYCCHVRMYGLQHDLDEGIRWHQI